MDANILETIVILLVYVSCFRLPFQINFQNIFFLRNGVMDFTIFKMKEAVVVILSFFLFYQKSTAREIILTFNS